MINKFTISLLILVLIFVSVFGYMKKDALISYFASKNPDNQVVNNTDAQLKNNNTSNYNIIDTSKSTKFFKDGDWRYGFSYKNVGNISSGKYQGYTRVLFIVQQMVGENTQSAYYYYLFATKDFKKFISFKDVQTVENETKDEIVYVNPEDITFDTEASNFFNLPPTIDIDDNYFLKTSINDYGYNLFVDIDSYSKSIKNYNNYYSGKSNIIENKKFNNYEAILINDFSSNIYLNDSGIHLKYILTPKLKTTVTPNYTNMNDTYGPLLSGFTFNSLNDSTVKFKKYELNYNGNVSLFGFYAVTMPDSDLELLTDAVGPKIYRVKNTNNKFYKDVIVSSYKARVSRERNTEVNYDLNIKNGAILLMKTPFDSYIILNEVEKTERMMGGGKPVIYLYPQTESKISLKFNNPMVFNNVVPNYSKEWLVLANTQGVLKDLKPELTPCSMIKETLSTTYAKNACEKNEYPYLYWSGAVYNSYEFPKLVSGFVVEKKNLAQFFEENLSFIGFNEKEISDFKEFWVPELNSKGNNFFVISFLQNNELDRLFPMTISPKPDSQIRIFMNWQGFDSKPEIQPQNLVKYPRNGYVLTEWGGLKK